MSTEMDNWKLKEKESFAFAKTKNRDITFQICCIQAIWSRKEEKKWWKLSQKIIYVNNDKSIYMNSFPFPFFSI